MPGDGKGPRVAVWIVEGEETLGGKGFISYHHNYDGSFIPSSCTCQNLSRCTLSKCRVLLDMNHTLNNGSFLKNMYCYG